MRFNFAADPDAQPANGSIRSTDPFTGAGGTLANNGRSFQPGQPARIEDAFNAIGYSPSTKAPPLRVAEPKEWLGWAEVRGATLDRWGSSSAVPGATVVYGNQINLLAGLTRRFTPRTSSPAYSAATRPRLSFRCALGPAERRRRTVGSYLGWKITQGVRFDAGVAYSGNGFDGTAGTAAGSFTGHRWLVTGGFTGAYRNYGIRSNHRRASTRYGNMKTPTPIRSAPCKPRATSRQAAPAPASNWLIRSHGPVRPS